MAFTTKHSPAQAVSLTGSPSAPPRVPLEMLRRFPEMEDYSNSVQEWWDRFSDMLQRDRNQLQSVLQSLESRVKALESK